MCFSPFSIYLQISHSLFVLVLFLSYWSRALPILLSMFESLTLYHTYYLLECSYDSAVRQFYCTGKGGRTSYVETYQAWRVRFFDFRSSFYLYPGTLPNKLWPPGQIYKCTQVHFFRQVKEGLSLPPFYLPLFVSNFYRITPKLLVSKEKNTPQQFKKNKKCQLTRIAATFNQRRYRKKQGTCIHLIIAVSTMVCSDLV